MVTSSEPLSDIDRIVGGRVETLMEAVCDRQHLMDLLVIDEAELCNVLAGRQRLRAWQILALMQALALPAGYFYRPSPVEAAESYPRAL